MGPLDPHGPDRGTKYMNFTDTLSSSKEISLFHFTQSFILHCFPLHFSKLYFEAFGCSASVYWKANLV